MYVVLSYILLTSAAPAAAAAVVWLCGLVAVSCRAVPCHRAKDPVADGGHDRATQARARQQGLRLLRGVLRSAEPGRQGRRRRSGGQPQQELKTK